MDETIYYEGNAYQCQPHLSEPGWVIYFAEKAARDWRWLVVLFFQGMRPRMLVDEENCFNYASYPLAAAFIRRRNRVARLAKRSALEGLIPGGVDRFKLVQMTITDVMAILDGRKNKSDFFHPDFGQVAPKSVEEARANRALKKARSFQFPQV